MQLFADTALNSIVGGLSVNALAAGVLLLVVVLISPSGGAAMEPAA